jgi:hypothetical protein
MLSLKARNVLVDGGAKSKSRRNRSRVSGSAEASVVIVVEGGGDGEEGDPTEDVIDAPSARRREPCEV